MTTVLVWVLVYATHVNYGSVTGITGDFASSKDCERVLSAMSDAAATTGAANGFHGQCVQVQKPYR